MKIAVLVSGGGTNLQAIIDAVADGKITNTEIALVISNKESAYALERAKNAGIEGKFISPKQFDSVIVPDVSAKDYCTDVDRHLLYVACTRAMHRLCLCYCGECCEFLK